MPTEINEEAPLRGAHSRFKRLSAIVLFSLLAVWSFLPALTSVHLEAFSAELQTIAILLGTHGSHGVALADQAYPITAEFLYMSRSGLVDALQLLIRLTGNSGDGVFRFLILVSTAVFVLSSIKVAQRWCQESRLLLFAVIVLTPGMVEISFFFSDNLPSAALAMLALACVPAKEEHPLRWLAVGAAFAAAILVRFDASLIAPALGICLLLDEPRASTVLVRAVLFVSAFAIVFLAAQLMTPFRLSESVQITRLFGGLHAWIQGAAREQEVSLGFFGVVTPILLLAGIVRNWRTHNWRWIGGLIILPALFYLFALPKAIEIRMFLLLGTPAILIHGATGIRVIAEQWTSKVQTRRLLAVAMASLVTFVMLGPVSLTMRDGPRTPYGRIWAILVWQEWQGKVTAGMEDLDKVVASVQPGETVLAISSHYNADDYFRLRLLENGFDLLPSVGVEEAFRGASEVFRKGDRTVLHLRCPDPYLILSQWWHQAVPYSQALQMKWELNSIPPESYNRAVLLNSDQVPGFILNGLQPHAKNNWPWRATIPENRLIPRSASIDFGIVSVEELTTKQVEAIRLSANAEVESSQKRARAWNPITSYPEFHRKFLWRFGQAP